ncbi:MAG: phage integrase SAM-like domain-containing protein, partial [Flavobacteriales bacterium]|nr:phage integrase SAM-like domain-containing protein [Flavobacteriales bacterium]
MPENTYSILFQAKLSKKNRFGKLPIYARVTVNGKRSEISIQRSIEPKSWNSGKGKARSNTEEGRSINEYLEHVRVRLLGHYSDLVKEGKTVTAQKVRDLFLNITSSQHTIMSAFKHNNAQMTKEIGNGLAYGSVKNYYTTIKYVPEYLQHEYRVDDMPLTELNHQWIVGFELFLKTEKNNSQNAAMKHIQRLKRVINVALQNEWLERDPFMKFKCKFKRVNREFL